MGQPMPNPWLAGLTCLLICPIRRPLFACLLPCPRRLWSRAADTASAIQGPRQRLDHLPDLREIHFGAWELRTWKEIDAEDPERIRAYWECPGDVRPPGGESWHEVCARVDRAIDSLIAAHTGRDLVVVGHFGQILTQIQRAERLTAEEAFSHRIDNLSLTEIHCAPGGWRAERINHLP